MSAQEFVSSPIATGGGGIFFEQHVDALFLALLLARGIPPILKDCQIEGVHLQTEHLGWHTDDLLIVGTRGAGGCRQLAAQVRRRFTISSKNEDCKKAFSDFWRDFKHNDKFDPKKDRLALVILRGTDTLLNAFNSVLDCARASTNGADFARRLETPGYLSKTARGHTTALGTIIEEIEGKAPSNKDFWRFLKVVHVVSYDLNTSTAQTEALIKSLLIQTTNEPDPVAAAEATWRELLEIVGSGMPAAASYSRSDLPQSLLSRHGAVTGEGGRALQALIAHSETTLDGIQTTIGQSVRIGRDALVAGVLESLDESQVVVVRGPAGSGKSVLAKSAIELLREDVFCLAFRAEEFAASHLDQTLHHAQVSVNTKRLQASLAAQGRKVLLVESVERLLEASVRDAFSDLLRLAQQDRSLQLVLTCRDYSVETVRTSLLDRAGLEVSVLEVPPLTDEELGQAVQEVPGLRSAVEDTTLKKLLRYPYLLDKAAGMDWSNAGTFPGDERAFRSKCWREVVCLEGVAGAGMPRRREKVFMEIALRRARALSPYVQCGDLDSEAMGKLVNDDLVVISKETSALAAPAHDVLEDWAIIWWLDRQFSLREHEAQALADDIGGYPAIRRGYRQWLAERMESETERASAFVLSSFADESLPAHFRDDTLVCTLLSSSAVDFLGRNRERLLEDHGRLLVRVIHLLRVACKKTPEWLPGREAVASQLLVPKGEAWLAVLEIVSNGLDDLLPRNRALLLGLLEDWAYPLDSSTLSPPGFQEGGKIAFALLAQSSDYGMDDVQKRALKVIAQIPRADATAFEDLLQRGCTVDRGYTVDRNDWAASELAKILLAGVSGGSACRDFPGQMVRLGTAQFCLSDEDLQPNRGSHSRMDIEPVFGIRDRTHFDFVPASAIRGPFLPLLRSHPIVGVNFVTDLLNHSSSWYGEQRWPDDRLEPVRQLTLDIPGEGQITQWTNARLWCLSRGLSVGPYVLQTALMALESWLLGICQIADANVAPWLLKLLKDSNNVAVSAVVASVCNAHPDKGRRAALALLSSRELIQMDLRRRAQELHNPSLSSLLPLYDAEQRIYVAERSKSDSLPHRQHDLEALAVKLQSGGQGEDVWQILDRHRAALPPVDEQSEDDRLWRLALHRMDVRGFRRIEPEPDSRGRDVVPEGDSAGERRVFYGPGTLEEDVQELVDRHTPVQSRQQSDLALLNWGLSAWRQNQSGTSENGAWQTNLVEAKARDREPHEPEDYTRDGPALVAAVCVRDHWEDVSSEDRAWCIEKLISELDREAESDDIAVREARSALQPDRFAAYVLPRVLSEYNPEDPDPRIRAVVARALTHPVREVVEYAAAGTGHYLRGAWQDFAQLCVGAVAMQARLIDEFRTAREHKPFGGLRADELTRKAVPNVRACIARGNVDVKNELARLDLASWPGQIAAQTILRILGYWPDSRLAIQFHGRVVSALVEGWNEERRDRGRVNGRRNHAFEGECAERIASFVLGLQATNALALCEPLFAAAGDHPRDIAQFVQCLILEEDHFEGETPFWDIWQAFAEQLCKASWIANLDSRRVVGKELLSIMFLGVEWKEGVRHWRRVEGHSGRIDALVGRLPASAAVLGAYSRFLREIGERSLPNGFVIVADRLSAGTPSKMLAGGNTVFDIETLLRRYVYGEPLRLKSNPKLRTAVLRILDELVEAGSSAAFRMRDDFVTPIGA